MQPLARLSATEKRALARLSAIEKRYPGVHALRGAELEIAEAEAHALIGENGAGKSTLVRILCGVERADAGMVEFAGERRAFHSPLAARAAGIAVIHQELARIPALSVAENLLLGREPMRWFGIDRRALHARAREALARVGLALDVEQRMDALPLALQQRVLIAQALDLDARLLVLDEPTASLDQPEVELLFRELERWKARGRSLLFIGHRLDEVLRIADRTSVLAAGRRVAVFTRAEASERKLVEAMLGRTLDAAPARVERAASFGAPLLVARGVGAARVLDPTDLDVHAGEIVGLAGLLGSGRSELAGLVCGALRRTSGSVWIGGTALPPGALRRALAGGLMLAPEERQRDGLVLELSIRENIALTLERGWQRVAPARQAELARRYVELLGIACTDVEQPVRTLSGGNQQKVVLARLLAARPKVLVLDEPTRGVDVGAKREIERELAELARQGLGVVLISSTLEEVLRSADRVVVLRAQRKVAELDAEVATPERVLAAMAGERTAPV
jgi:galactofuranose transport system ATP-binding protein